jgi:hypothetical protein
MQKSQHDIITMVGKMKNKHKKILQLARTSVAYLLQFALAGSKIFLESRSENSN